MSSDQQATTPLQTARNLLRHRKLDEAIALVREIQQADQDNREAQELLGMALFLSRKFEEARDAFDLLVRMDPKNATAWVNLGAVQNVLQDHQASIRSLRNAIKRDKKSASAYYNMGIAQRAMKMNSMAISAYKEAIRLDPTLADAYVNLGNLYIEMNNLTQAVRMLEDGIKKCPQAKKLPVILEKAKRAKDGIRVEDAPLGRLVNEEELRNKQIRTAPRHLDDVQRVQERESLQGLVKTIRRSTKPVVTILDESLHHQLHILDLAASGKDTRAEAPAVFDEMRKTLDETERLRTLTREAIAEIRTHLRQTDPGL